MKGFRYIVLVIFLSFFGTNVSLARAFYPIFTVNKEIKVDKTKKHVKFLHSSYVSKKITEQKKPKKLKGINVTEPHTEAKITRSFYKCVEFSLSLSKNNYILRSYYFDGQRGPPSLNS